MREPPAICMDLSSQDPPRSKAILPMLKGRSKQHWQLISAPPNARHLGLLPSPANCRCLFPCERIQALDLSFTSGSSSWTAALFLSETTKTRWVWAKYILVSFFGGFLKTVGCPFGSPNKRPNKGATLKKHTPMEFCRECRDPASVYVAFGQPRAACPGRSWLNC